MRIIKSVKQTKPTGVGQFCKVKGKDRKGKPRAWKLHLWFLCSFQSKGSDRRDGSLHGGLIL